MTAAQLLSNIAWALLLQVIAGVAFALWRRSSATGAPASAGVKDVVAAPASFSGAWSGWREFRAVPREFEDAAQTQRSFHRQLRDRNCMDCHAGNNHKQATCRGCHGHTPANMEGKRESD